MKKWFYLRISCLLYCAISLAQKETLPCIVITDSGTEFHGYIKSDDADDIRRGFNLYKNKDQSMRINPLACKTVQIDSVTYRSVEYRSQKPRFMKELVVGTKASLYLDSYSMAGNIPGQGLASWYNDDYYLLREGNWQLVKEGQLLKKPESYFPDAIPLCKVIKNTKRADIQMEKWVWQYNNLFPE